MGLEDLNMNVDCLVAVGKNFLSRNAALACLFLSSCIVCPAILTLVRLRKLLPTAEDEIFSRLEKSEVESN